MKYILFIFAILLTHSVAYAGGHPFHIQNVQNFAREIDPTADFISQKNWLDVLRRQPIVSGKGKPTYGTMKAINDNCNKKAYKVTPAWPTPNEFTAADSGDCKGFAICKYYALRKAGFAASQLNLWSGDYNGVPHLVLVVRLEDKQYVLDIGAESNLPLAKDYFYRNFQPSYRFNEIGWDVN